MTIDAKFSEYAQGEVRTLEREGYTRKERLIASPQGAWVKTQGQEVINLCANNYLGLSNDPEIIGAAKQALDDYGFGLSSVRFICGTQTIHRALETELSHFLGMEDTMLFSSCFDANAGVFEALLGAEDAIISDALNHASIIDGIRLCKAQRFRYANNDTRDLEAQLEESKDARFRLIVTDGVFSMDGVFADLQTICDLAEKHNALVMVDDSHAVGFVGQTGRGTHERASVMNRVDILTGTLGKALGGASGGYISARKDVIELLRQRARPYLFSNSLAPMIVQTSLMVLDLVERKPQLRTRLWENTRYVRSTLSSFGFKLLGSEHPIVPVLLKDARVAATMAEELLHEGVYVVSFSYPVVPRGEARLRVQVSAAHRQDDLEIAVNAFKRVGVKLGIIS